MMLEEAKNFIINVDYLSFLYIKQLILKFISSICVQQNR